MTEAELNAMMNSMTPEEAASLGALLGGIILAVLFFALAVWVFQIIVLWRIFKKAGEPGWKSIIPVYNNYTLFKISWQTKFFWITIALSVVGSIFSTIAQSSGSIIISLLMYLISIATLVLLIMQNYKLSKSFGHGAGFTVGLILLAPIFQIILAFGSSEYKGADL